MARGLCLILEHVFISDMKYMGESAPCCLGICKCIGGFNSSLGCHYVQLWKFIVQIIQL